MTPSERRVYARNRAKGYGAALSLSLAKHTPRYAFAWDGKNDPTGTLDVGGVRLVARIESDHYWSVEDEYGKLSRDPDSYGAPAFEDPAWKQRAWDRFEGGECDPSDRYFHTPSGETFAGLWDYNRKHTGMARHAAWLDARRTMIRDLDRLHRAMNGDPDWEPVGCTVSAMIGETEVATASIWGYAFERDYSADLDRQLDDVAADVVAEVMYDLPASIEATRASLTAQASRLAATAQALPVYA